jgi:hypothetical protein
LNNKPAKDETIGKKSPDMAAKASDPRAQIDHPKPELIQFVADRP